MSQNTEEKVRPISPEDVAKAKVQILPAFVITIFNGLIAKNYCSGVARVTQEEVVALLIQSGHAQSSQQVIDNHWLDVEDVYREEGWSVEYDKPGYNETYLAYYIFKRKRS